MAKATKTNQSHNVTWAIAARMWWAVTWRTFVWVSIPLMLVQFMFTWLQQPELAKGMLGLSMMMLPEIPSMLVSMVQTTGFWFFIAITVYSLVGAWYVYGIVLKKGQLGKIRFTVED